LLLTGAIFKATVPDESDEERRELERCVECLHRRLVVNSGYVANYRMVAEAARPKAKQSATRSAKARREEMIRHEMEKEKEKLSSPLPAEATTASHSH
jgi:hypothetical protein